MNFNFEPVRNKPHDAGSFHPWNLLELGLALRQWNKKNVAPNVPAHDFHHLRASHVLKTGNLNVIAGFNPEAPRMFAVAVDKSGAEGCEHKQNSSHADPRQASGSLFGD